MLFHWTDDELKEAAAQLGAQFPQGSSAAIVDAVTKAADSRVPGDGVDSLVERAAIFLVVPADGSRPKAHQRL